MGRGKPTRCQDLHADCRGRRRADGGGRHLGRGPCGGTGAVGTAALCDGTLGHWLARCQGGRRRGSRWRGRVGAGIWLAQSRCDGFALPHGFAQGPGLGDSGVMAVAYVVCTQKPAGRDCAGHCGCHGGHLCALGQDQRAVEPGKDGGAGQGAGCCAGVGLQCGHGRLVRDHQAADCVCLEQDQVGIWLWG